MAFVRCFFAVVLVAASGCISPSFVAEHSDPPGGWPVNLLEPSALWCAYGAGPFAFRVDAGDGWGRSSSTATLSRDGTLTLLSTQSSWDSPPPMRQTRLVNISQSDADAWLSEVGASVEGERVTEFVLARGSPRGGDLASFCTRIAREMPFFEGETEATCTDAGGTHLASWTLFGHHSAVVYCGDLPEREASLLRDWSRLRDNAWNDIVA